MNAKTRLIIILTLVVVIASAMWFFQDGSAGRGEVRNVLLISIDTCRADRLSCYGYNRRTTPNIDAIAEEGVLFENAVSTIPLTLPAHSSMLTGTIPPYHGVHDNLGYQLGDDNVTLAEILKDNGFTTCGIVSSFVLDSRFGIDQGFDFYQDQFKEEDLSPGQYSERAGGEASSLAEKWLDEHRDDRFFLFLHYYDPHYPYNPPEPFKSKFMESLYDGEIAYADHCIGKVIKKLKSLDLYDSTLIVIAGDHGESLQEHGESTHGYFIYQSAVKVPLIVKLPGKGKPKKDTRTVSLIDIVPTILGSLNIPIPSEVMGKDLLGNVKVGDNPELSEYSFCEALMPTKYGCNSLLGVVDGDWKYIQTTRPELYDLKNDPDEKVNLVSQNPQRVRILKDILGQILEAGVNKGAKDSKKGLDEESKKRLESLGYLSGSSVDESFDFDQSRKDPKDYVDIAEVEGRVTYLIKKKTFDRARELCVQLVSEHPDMAYAHFLLGNVYGKEEKFQEAQEQYSMSLDMDPDFRDAHVNMGVLMANLKKHEEGISYWKTALKLNFENDPKINVNIAKSLVHLGKTDEAIIHCNRALESDPQDDRAHACIADIYIAKGQTDLALEHLNKSLQFKPDQAGVCNKKAELLYLNSEVLSAIQYWKKALELNPEMVLVRNNLAWVLSTHKDEKIRNTSEALRHAEKACELTEFKGPESLDTYSAALASAGRFEEAIQTAVKAEEIFLSSGMEGKAEEVRGRLELYKAGKPYRE